MVAATDGGRRVKILRVRIEGFRSLRAPQRIDLKDGRSLCVLAENGQGKSSLVDALEFWSTGDVAWVHRDGVGLGALVHLDSDTAVVELRTTTQTASRAITGTRVSGFTAGEGLMELGFSPGPIPILRHRTMARFVEQSANEKRAELLTMLGLSGLVEFRRGLQRAAR